MTHIPFYNSKERSPTCRPCFFLACITLRCTVLYFLVLLCLLRYIRIAQRNNDLCLPNYTIIIATRMGVIQVFIRGRNSKPFPSIKYNITHNKQNKNVVYSCKCGSVKNVHRMQYISILYCTAPYPQDTHIVHAAHAV
jgi:hypothetical protein